MVKTMPFAHNKQHLHPMLDLLVLIDRILSNFNEDSGVVSKMVDICEGAFKYTSNRLMKEVFMLFK